MTYVVVPMRQWCGARLSCARDEWADSWDVIEPRSGHVIACCVRRVDAEAVAAGQWATDELQRLQREREHARLVVCYALGVDHDTLDEAISALLAGHAELIMRIDGARTAAVAA